MINKALKNLDVLTLSGPYLSLSTNVSIILKGAGSKENCPGFFQNGKVQVDI